MNENQPTQDERIMAALAHGSALIFGMGIVIAVVIWITQKDRSRYAVFQALEAAVFQFVGLLVQAVTWCCWLALYFVSFIPLMAAAEAGGDPPFIFWASMMLMFVPLALMGLWVLGGLWGAVRTLQGRDFRYLLLGNQLKRWLSQ